MLARYGEYRALGIRCPFCGREDTTEFAHRGVYLAVECAKVRGGCGARGPEEVKRRDAVALWNRRWDAESQGNAGYSSESAVDGEDRYASDNPHQTDGGDAEAVLFTEGLRRIG